MGKKITYSIPENSSFEPEEVKKDIEELERIKAQGKLSEPGYAELALLRNFQEFQK
jgi:hypothetical protein